MFASIKDILKNPILNSNVTINGWIRTKRSNGKIGFIEINDGSTLKGIQAVINEEENQFSEKDRSLLNLMIFQNLLKLFYLLNFWKLNMQFL